MRRVVVTGLGIVSPLGCGVDVNWRRLIAGECGFKRIDTFEVDDLACQIAAVVPRGDGADGTFNPDDWFEPKEQRKVDDFIIYAACAATQALTDAGWEADTAEKQEIDRRADRLGHRRPWRHLRDVDHAAGERVRAASRPSSFPAGSSISPRAMCRSCIASRARITPS